MHMLDLFTKGRKKTTIENVPGANALQVGSGIADDDIAHNLSISSTGTRKTQKKPDGKDAPLREETYSSKGGVPSAKVSFIIQEVDELDEFLSTTGFK
jgi:hypothetical protein